jgi:hypothetical protein
MFLTGGTTVVRTEGSPSANPTGDVNWGLGPRVSQKAGLLRRAHVGALRAGAGNIVIVVDRSRDCVKRVSRPNCHISALFRGACGDVTPLHPTTAARTRRILHRKRFGENTI